MGGGGKETTPVYDMDRAMKTQNVGVASSLGNMSLRKNADGSYSRVFEDSEADTKRNNLINQGLGALSLDPTEAEDAYYNSAARLLTPQFDRQRDRLDESLINRGIGVGNSQYTTAMGDLEDSQNTTLKNLADEAVFQGQNLIGTKVGNINSLSGGRDIGLLAGMGSTNNAYDNYYQSLVQRANEKAAGSNSMMGTIGTLAGAGIGAYFGGPAGMAAGASAGGALSGS